jgi:pimeloyl-ACP methyl ester carboxylesterase
MKWTKEQTAAKIRYGSEAQGSVVEEHLVEQLVDPEKDDGPTFYLYYFTKDFTFMRPASAKSKPDVRDRTVLFMSGGPGEVNRPGSSNFGDLDGYRIVYFHLRGAGFSQLPASNYYDRFLRTKYAVEDIEAIRKNLLGEKKPWAAIIGHSYGTVLAQQYAHKHGEYVEKLVLSAPFSRHHSTKETVQFNSLKKIYDAEFFKFLKELKTSVDVADVINLVATRAQEVSDRAEEEFGSVHFLAEIYGRLLTKDDEATRFISLLKEKRLDYSLAFFKALRRLRQIGWLPHDEDLAKGSNENVDTVQQLAALLIAKEILEKESDSYSIVQLNKWLEYLLRRSSDSELLENLTAQVMNAEMYFKAGHVNTPRVFYVVSIYDGLNETILKKVRAEADVKGAILSLGGNQSGMNESLCRIAVENDAIKGWNPKQHIHEVPTLILKGGADPVTQGGQADYVFREALCGKRVLIEFPGVGHSMSLPRMIEDNINTRDYLLQEFIAHDFDNLKRTVLPKVRGAFEELLKQDSHKRYRPLHVQAKCISRSDEEVSW